MVPTLMTDLSAATIDPAALSTRGPPPSEGASYIPFADRYAVVPDQGSGQGVGFQVIAASHCFPASSEKFLLGMEIMEPIGEA